MVQGFPQHEIDDFESVLSAPRFATYLRESQGDRNHAVQLYCWNTEISASFYKLLQFFEVAVRNGVVEALEKEFTANWHLNRGFAHTLPQLKGGRGYQPNDDLKSCATRLPTSGKVVAELKFAFWQYMFVKGQDNRLWIPHFATVFPGYDKNLSIEQARSSAYSCIEKVRKFRNRIAHHEPIFTRNLADERDQILRLVEWRRPSVAAWLRQVETVTGLLQTRP